ncbi:FMN-binding negative transcriptional regulator [Sneathiella sp.]|uniref:FMN-binding negative transcriptional regulator n=1 Tax=Sneathiella sp. TaxID=1964365 RepID=UPI002FE42946
MYVPPSFKAPEKETLTRLMQTANFGLLISRGGADGLVATHLPFAYDAGRGEFGTLIAHMARSNPHADILEEDEALVVFLGPHHYISPNYYVTDGNVPTWNYVAAHAYGTPVILRDDAAVRAVLERQTAEQERAMPTPWNPEGLDPARYQALLRGVTVFEIEIQRIDAKAKLGQNKSPADQASMTTAIGRLWD